MPRPNPVPVPPPPLWGLALCGGRGSRLGQDKGTLDYHGLPQARWLHGLLSALCERAFVSIRPDQAALAAYRGLPTVLDLGGVGGPAAGLLAAWASTQEVAWLVVAADMPLVDLPLLRRLIDARDPAAHATAFRHADGTPEPLCTIWEPHARPLVAAQSPRYSLRDVLERGRVAEGGAAAEEQLASVNTLADDARVRARLAATAM